MTVTFEELGFLTARFNEVGRLPTLTNERTPWVVSLHDLELVAKYLKTAPEFFHYLKRRIAFNAQRSVGALDEIDWLGRYFNDTLSLTELQQALAANPSATASLTSHRAEIDNYEHYENGIRKTRTPRPAAKTHKGVRTLLNSLSRWAGMGYIDAGIALLDLPAKQRTALAKRILSAARSIRKGHYTQEQAITNDREIAFVCMITRDIMGIEPIETKIGFGIAKRNVYLEID